jgi:hypothetical protein
LAHLGVARANAMEARSAQCVAADVARVQLHSTLTVSKRRPPARSPQSSVARRLITSTIPSGAPRASFRPIEICIPLFCDSCERRHAAQVFSIWINEHDSSDTRGDDQARTKMTRESPGIFEVRIRNGYRPILHLRAASE